MVLTSLLDFVDDPVLEFGSWEKQSEI